MKRDIKDLYEWKREYSHMQMYRLSSLLGVVILLSKFNIGIDSSGKGMSFFLGRMIKKKVISRVARRKLPWGLIYEAE